VRWLIISIPIMRTTVEIWKHACRLSRERRYGDLEQSDGFERLSVLSLAAVISWDRWALRDVYIWCGVLREGDAGLSKPSSIYGDAGEFMLGVRAYLL
jgi:hypothetical protein